MTWVFGVQMHRQNIFFIAQELMILNAPYKGESLIEAQQNGATLEQLRTYCVGFWYKGKILKLGVLTEREAAFITNANHARILHQQRVLL